MRGVSIGGPCSPRFEGQLDRLLRDVRGIRGSHAKAPREPFEAFCLAFEPFELLFRGLA